MNIINIQDFFNFEKNSPINRIAYSKNDAIYKLQIMKKMKQLGMKIAIDDVGNICGTLPGKHEKSKSFVLGSHTDSVTDGGQFDGPVGVYMALKAIENFKDSGQPQYGNLKAIIYACEESTRFKTACLGSYYLNGKLPYEKLETLKDKNGITFNDAIAEYKNYIFSHLAEYNLDLSDIELVDKVLNQKEISEAIEAHIEQANTLSDSSISIGGVTSIVKPLRGTIKVNGKNSIITSAQIITDLNELALEDVKNGKNETYRITVPEFHTKVTDSNEQTIFRKTDTNNILLITAHGESNHSGATPMNERKDAVLALSHLILKLNELQAENPNLSFEFLSSSTNIWGANQIQDNANIAIKIEPAALAGIVKEYAEEIKQAHKVSFDISETTHISVQKNPEVELFVDVRQQYPATAKNTEKKLYELFKNIQESEKYTDSTIDFRITTMDTPVKTSPELLENISKICYERKYPCKLMQSWAGHDLACILNPDISNGKKILFFIPSEGGSHNPNESTTQQSINIGTEVYSDLLKERILNLKDKSKKHSDIER